MPPKKPRLLPTKSCEDSLICLAVPIHTMGRRNIFVDSGILIIYEQCKALYRVMGMKTLILLDPKFKEPFEERNRPEETGVWPIYSSTEWRVHKRWYCIDAGTQVANDYLNAFVCPIDWILTNRKLMVPSLKLQSEDHWHHPMIPLVLRIMVSGSEGSDDPMSNQWVLMNPLEAVSCMLADKVMWNGEPMRKRCLRIVSHYIAPAHAKPLYGSKGYVMNEPMPSELKPFKRSDEEVKKRLQTKQDPFRVSFIGRMTKAKNIPQILDTTQVLFAHHGIKIEIVTAGAVIMDGTYSRTCADDAKNNLVERIEDGGKKGRLGYFSDILPRQQCVLYASPREAGSCAVPRESAYVGVPALIPDRDWAHALSMGLPYPFIYRSEEECITLVKRIRDGKITDEEVRQFNAFRNHPKVMQFVDEAAMEMHGIAKSLVDPWITSFRKRSHSKIDSAFEKSYRIGEEFKWSELTDLFWKKHKVLIGEFRMTYSLMHVYKFLQNRIECIDPAVGIFKRLT